jgi:restriction system protein
MLPVIEAIKSLGGSGTNEEIHDRLAEQMRFPQHVIDEPFSDGTTTKLRYRINWAKSYLKAFGALSNSTRGVWALTELGSKIEYGQEAEIKRTVRLASVAKRKPKQTDEDEIQDELSELAVEEPANWRDRLLSVILSMSPDAFERLCKRVLREAGFSSVEVTGKSGDGGVDGFGVLRVGLISFRVVF